MVGVIGASALLPNRAAQILASAVPPASTDPARTDTSSSTRSQNLLAARHLQEVAGKVAHNGRLLTRGEAAFARILPGAPGGLERVASGGSDLAHALEPIADVVTPPISALAAVSDLKEASTNPGALNDAKAAFSVVSAGAAFAALFAGEFAGGIALASGLVALGLDLFGKLEEHLARHGAAKPASAGISPT